MAEILFSFIGEMTPTMKKVIKEFENQSGHRVNVEIMGWGDAWQQILGWSMQESSPHVSQVGSTWAASLYRFNALRPFTLTEVRSMGSQIAFLPQAWQSAQAGSLELWAVPWNTYTFLLLYRKDLLQKAGIDEQKAFINTNALAETLSKLQESGVQNPWLVPLSKGYLSTLHYVASWVWEADGDFISADGKRAVFNQPEALDAMIRYFELLRFMKKVPLPFWPDGSQGMFVQGDAAVTVIGADFPYSWLKNNLISEQLRENIGFAPMPGVPWIGGDHLVIWKQVRIDPDIEQASVEFVRYLTSHSAQTANAQGDDTQFPSRPDAFASLPYQGSQLTDSLLTSLHTGRSHRATSNWTKIEHQFARAFGEIGENVLKGMSATEAVTARIQTLATWFNAMLR